MRLVFLLVTALILFQCTPAYDIIIRRGDVNDGLGGPSEILDIAIHDQKIVKIAPRIKAKADLEINAQGQVVCPGFIDLHAHLEPLALYPDAESHIRQGVTTALGGPDGGSPFPIQTYLDTLSMTGTGLNVGYLIGHNTVRNHVMGLVNRAPTQVELDSMGVLIGSSIDQGAFGMSTGLKYLPGTFGKTDEIIALARIAAAKGGIYTSHLREEGLGLLHAVEEAILIAEEARIPVVLTHHKVIGQPMWGASEKTLAMVDAARSRGLDVVMDQYPYTASHTGLRVIIPPWALEGPRDQFAIRCEDPLLRDSIKRGIIFNIINDRGGNDLRRIQFAKIDWVPEMTGKTLHDLLEFRGIEPTVENGADMVIEIQLHRGANCIFHVMDDGDVERIMQHPFTMIASDGRLTQYGQGHPHPRAYGTFPRVLGHYVREKRILTLEEAIRKMTSLPAAVLGLTSRGVLSEGNWADITIFDPEVVKDQATFEDPHQYPLGINYVIINGTVAVAEGTFQDVKAGKVLKKE
ncbi:MAG: D-aminoacylase [Saprospiraceae bacterium]|nr:D-aminoacylase [Saprospiraceae bacterium]